MTHLLRPKRVALGVTLIELMISLVLGLLVIGAAFTIFLSNQQTFRIKQELDRAQDSFRFASQTIMRVVNQGIIIQPVLVEDEFPSFLSVRQNPSPGMVNCFGNAIVANADVDTVINSFFASNGNLHCHVEVVRNNGTSDEMTEVLVRGLDQDRSEFRFGISNPDPSNPTSGAWNNNDFWELEDVVTNWPSVRSVRVRLAMQDGTGAIGPVALFSATMRCGSLDTGCGTDSGNN